MRPLVLGHLPPTPRNVTAGHGPGPQSAVGPHRCEADRHRQAFGTGPHEGRDRRRTDAVRFLEAALRALSVFPGGFTEDAAERVLGGTGDTLALLEPLAGQSLIKVGDTPSGVRFHRLETLREFGAARRAEAGEDAVVTDRFLTWARDFGRAHHDVLFRSDPLPSWIRIRAEQDNLVLALRYVLSRADLSTTAALTAVLSSLWATDSHHARLAALAAETGGPLSHFLPGPENTAAAHD